jgi:AraC-like DNA-binding protein
MRSRLTQIKNWEHLGEAANYSLGAFAKSCGTSIRQLERYFLQSRGVTPSQWLNELRQRKALQLIREGASVKEAAAKLGFKQPSHFSRQFKKFYQVAPIEVCAAYLTKPAFKRVNCIGFVIQSLISGVALSSGF